MQLLVWFSVVLICKIIKPFCLIQPKTLNLQILKICNCLSETILTNWFVWRREKETTFTRASRFYLSQLQHLKSAGGWSRWGDCYCCFIRGVAGNKLAERATNSLSTMGQSTKCNLPLPQKRLHKDLVSNVSNLITVALCHIMAILKNNWVCVPQKYLPPFAEKRIREGKKFAMSINGKKVEIVVFNLSKWIIEMWNLSRI